MSVSAPAGIAGASASTAQNQPAQGVPVGAPAEAVENRPTAVTASSDGAKASNDRQASGSKAKREELAKARAKLKAAELALKAAEAELVADQTAQAEVDVIVSDKVDIAMRNRDVEDAKAMVKKLEEEVARLPLVDHFL